MVQAMTTLRKMHLVVFLLARPTAHRHGAWRHPEADIGLFTPEWHEHIARVLEQGKFASLFLCQGSAATCRVGGLAGVPATPLGPAAMQLISLLNHEPALSGFHLTMAVIWLN